MCVCMCVVSVVCGCEHAFSTDVILTAETIYDSCSTLRLITCMHDLLKPEGVAYVAGCQRPMCACA